MAPVEATSLSSFLEKDFQELTVKYDMLWEVEDPEETPYKTKYEARKLLEEAVKTLEALLEQDPEGPDAERGKEALARLFLYLGKNLYFCEEVPQAELYFTRSLERYLRSPLRLEPKPFVHIQDVLNQLGMLWCNRQGFSEGMNFLRRAQIMFTKRPQAVKDSIEQRADDNFTLTMFYLAQAYGALQKPALSARFCAETMSRQLEYNTPGRRPTELTEKDPFDCKDWVRNCCSLSDYFINEGMFWTAEYLLHSGLAMLNRCEEIARVRPENYLELRAECLRDMGNLYATRLRYARTCREHPLDGPDVWRGEQRKLPDGEGKASEGSRLTFRCAADRGESRPPEGGTGPIHWDSVFPEVVHLEDEEAHDNKMAEEEESGFEGAVDLRDGLRVRLPVYFQRLHEPTSNRMRRANAAFFAVQGELAIPGGDSSSSQSSPHYPNCIGASFESARELFKLGSSYFTRALGYFQLDGWVTEHVRILQELSKMYKTLLYWEKDPKRAAAMEMRRARMLSPLLDLLNPKHYVGFYRQLSYEAGEIFQELYELKDQGKLPNGQGSILDDDGPEDGTLEDLRRAARCNDLAKKALKHFTIFIETYHTDGKTPEKVEKDHTRAYLSARLNRARLHTKMRGLPVDEEIERHKEALKEYKFILDYGQRNAEACLSPEVGFEQELRLCQEMAGMLPSKLDQLAARRRR